MAAQPKELRQRPSWSSSLSADTDESDDWAFDSEFGDDEPTLESYNLNTSANLLDATRCGSISTPSKTNNDAIDHHDMKPILQNIAMAIGVILLSLLVALYATSKANISCPPTQTQTLTVHKLLTITLWHEKPVMSSHVFDETAWIGADGSVRWMQEETLMATTSTTTRTDASAGMATGSAAAEFDEVAYVLETDSGFEWFLDFIQRLFGRRPDVDELGDGSGEALSESNGMRSG
jgi:hypothetical protein